MVDWCRLFSKLLTTTTTLTLLLMTPLKAITNSTRNFLKRFSNKNNRWNFTFTIHRWYKKFKTAFLMLIRQKLLTNICFHPSQIFWLPVKFENVKLFKDDARRTVHECRLLETYNNLRNSRTVRKNHDDVKLKFP